MNALPGMTAGFSVGYSEVLKEIDSAEVKAGLVGVKPGESTSTAIGLMAEELRSVREKTGDDLGIICN